MNISHIPPDFNNTKDLGLPDDENIYLPGQFDSSINDSLTEINDRLEKMELDSKKESKNNRIRFIISAFLSAIAALAAAAALFPR